MTQREFRRGEPVIYRISKCTASPGPRAQRIAPSPRGEAYAYQVDKFWMVADLMDDGKLLLLTRRGKQRVVSCEDPNLRRPTWWERLRHADRFPRTTLLAQL